MNDVQNARTQPDHITKKIAAEEPVDAEAPWPVIDSCGHGYQDWRGADIEMGDVPGSVAFIDDLPSTGRA